MIMPELKAIHGTYYLWMYVPSIPGSVIVTLLWAAIGAGLCWKMFKTRSWFCSAFVLGCFCKVKDKTKNIGVLTVHSGMHRLYRSCRGSL
jgi:hypothetical protein